MNGKASYTHIASTPLSLLLLLSDILMKNLLLLTSVLFSGCAGMVTANDGDRVTVEHDGFISMESTRTVALKACQQNGKAEAKHVKTANKNPRFEPGFGVQLSTFQCM